ncbi:hypothetical protein J2X31_003288 [Flavobacterium arsenatis]|uniref:DUF4274 domain-containing protein n=1 Tax=Flavobacterium arsenatis TaxID=1484332 RepID=A0ABU1TTU0_9FLAO|nr:hypothetical protein [Flavobacterium arsenatis]MDR6969261.1 hypothetical protein [Flavobacterium arsenatis]
MELKEFEKQITNFDSIRNLDLSDKEDIEIHILYQEAEAYLLSHAWCDNVYEAWIGAQWDNILAIFLFKIKPNQEHIDQYVWLIVGDIPPAYIDIESAVDIKEALEGYIFIMKDWVQAVYKNESIEDYYPIEVPPTYEYAEMLEKRLMFIEEKMLPDL